MKTQKLIIPLCCLALSFSCKNEEKKETSTATQTPQTTVVKNSSEKTYAEISVAQGGNWVDGPRGHKEYSEGTSFKNVTKLTVPKEHTDHSWFIRYEGPGWESNKVGYRLYLDWRNAIDIFGKTTHDIILPKVGQDGFDSYHEMSDWGMDILKAGKSMGIGSIGRYVDGKVLHFETVEETTAEVSNSDNASSVFINYKGWKTAGDKIDLQSTLTITPNHRYTKHQITPSEAIEGIATGIVKFKDIELIEKSTEDNTWAYIATYGEQTLVPDKLGMAIFYKTAEVSQKTTGEHDHLLVFKPTTNRITYYFLGAWEKEKDGITNKEDFISYLDEKLNTLSNTNQLQ
ncbi:DUF4861 family protein [Joostella sp. CR20]|uniref:DUF4861 family protein n=1 Tax=Joostella sp. CR20 TaxID=2804312 RepID=UPI00313D92D3